MDVSTQSNQIIQTAQGSQSKTRLLIALWFPIILSLSGCFGDDTRSSGVGVLTIGSAVPTEAYKDILYTFTPAVLNSTTLPVTYSVSGLPSWAIFSTVTGTLSGIPDQSGVFSDIIISATDGKSQTTVAEYSITVLDDPLEQYAWHLLNTGQSNFSASAGTAGYDINLADAVNRGFTGRGIKIAVTDTGIEVVHEDLEANIIPNYSRDYRTTAPWAGDPSPSTAEFTSDHGTMVAGIIAAVGWNSIGSRGVAPNAGIAGLNLLGVGVSTTTQVMADALTGDFDIFNASWGLSIDFDATIDTSNLTALHRGAYLRGGRGAIYVKSAGNAFSPVAGQVYRTRDANTDYIASTRFPIIVGAMNASGTKSSYSSVGSNLWISAFGGEYGTTSPAVMSTDRTGCTYGASNSGAISNSFEDGDSLNASCNYTSTMNGTSSAAPMVSGIVALMLEANSQLGWRDVKKILATTARQVDTNFVAVTDRATDPVGTTWDAGWLTNGAGFKFHNYYGFGMIDASAAVTAAEAYVDYLGTEETTSVSTGVIATAIPDASATGAIVTFSVSSDLSIEEVTVTLSATHTYSGDIGVELTSPAGTTSTMLHMNNSFGGDTNLASFVMLSNAFYGESSDGTWTLKVIDAAAGNTGTITAATLRAWGTSP